MAGKTSGDSTRGVSDDIFRGDLGLVYDSGTPAKCPARPDSHRHLHRGVTRLAPTARNLSPARALAANNGAISMPYALFSHDDKLSKAYPTEADVWRHARA